MNLLNCEINNNNKPFKGMRRKPHESTNLVTQQQQIYENKPNRKRTVCISQARVAIFVLASTRYAVNDRFNPSQHECVSDNGISQSQI